MHGHLDTYHYSEKGNPQITPDGLLFGIGSCDTKGHLVAGLLSVVHAMQSETYNTIFYITAHEEKLKNAPQTIAFLKKYKSDTLNIDLEPTGTITGGYGAEIPKCQIVWAESPLEDMNLYRKAGIQRANLFSQYADQPIWPHIIVEGGRLLLTFVENDYIGKNNTIDETVINMCKGILKSVGCTEYYESASGGHSAQLSPTEFSLLNEIFGRHFPKLTHIPPVVSSSTIATSNSSFFSRKDRSLTLRYNFTSALTEPTVEPDPKTIIVGVAERGTNRHTGNSEAVSIDDLYHLVGTLIDINTRFGEQ